MVQKESPKLHLSKFRFCSRISTSRSYPIAYAIGTIFIATAQIGNNLGINFGLVNSKGTRVVYGQAGSNYSGGIVVRNAPPGTVITLN